MITTKQKPKRIKIWPELEAFGPIMFYIPPFAKAKSVVIEFTNCKRVDACGLNILLMRLVLLGFLNDVTSKHTDLIRPILPQIDRTLNDLGVFYYLNKWYGFLNKYKGTLLEGCYSFEHPSVKTPVTIRTTTGLRQYSFPIYMFDFDGPERRDGWSAFQKWILEIFHHFDGYQIPKYELLNIFKEMFKNSADHTNGNASFAIDIRENPEMSNGLISISFSFVDLGKGIYRNIQEILAAHHGRGAHGSLTEVYYKAMQKGFSTKSMHNNINMGLGMDVITRGSRSIGVNLSVFDAQSRGLLTAINDVTHSEIRRHFYDVKNQLVFCYYGSISCGARL